MVIESILDTDLYKLTMQYAVWRWFPRLKVAYKLVQRSPIPFPEHFHSRVQNELHSFSGIALSPVERDYLESLGWFPPPYLEFLQNYRFNPDQVSIGRSPSNQLEISVSGPWLETILWEVPLLALISELYFDSISSSTKTERLQDQSVRKTANKAEKLIRAGCRFSDFGTRRRFSRLHQHRVIEACLEAEERIPDVPDRGTFSGTSNLDIARKKGLPCVGTIAHEWFMAHSRISSLQLANRDALLRWLQAFHGRLSIALTDTYTTAFFLKSFDRVLAENFDGVRQDSGDPYGFVDRILDLYENYSLDPREKTLVFSDGLDPDQAIAIQRYVGDRAQTAFGIGTNLTNDLDGIDPMDLVIKLDSVAGLPVCKLTDDPDKATGSLEERERCRHIVNTTLESLASASS